MSLKFVWGSTRLGVGEHKVLVLKHFLDGEGQRDRHGEGEPLGHLQVQAMVDYRNNQDGRI